LDGDDAKDEHGDYVMRVASQFEQFKVV
jgi:hypothetical protein